MNEKKQIFLCKTCPFKFSGERDVTRWRNRAFEYCEQQVGGEKFVQLLENQDSRNRLRIVDKLQSKFFSRKIKRAVSRDHNFFRHASVVGGVGYARVLNDPRIPKTEFFTPGRRFRVRLRLVWSVSLTVNLIIKAFRNFFRHSSLRSSDDVTACQRETAIKFADQNEDGPLDLVLFTGRVALARTCKNLHDVMTLKHADDVRQCCYKDPN